MLVLFFYVAASIVGIGGLAGGGSSVPHVPISAPVADDILLPTMGS